jgi:hypothetical protein
MKVPWIWITSFRHSGWEEDENRSCKELKSSVYS